MNVCMRVCRAFQEALAAKNLPPNGGDVSLIPELGRCLEEGMAIHSSIPTWRISWPGPWWAMIHRVAELDTTEVASCKLMRVCNEAAVSIFPGCLLVSVNRNFYHK